MYQIVDISFGKQTNDQTIPNNSDLYDLYLKHKQLEKKLSYMKDSSAKGYDKTQKAIVKAKDKFEKLKAKNELRKEKAEVKAMKSTSIHSIKYAYVVFREMAGCEHSKLFYNVSFGYRVFINMFKCCPCIKPKHQKLRTLYFTD